MTTFNLTPISARNAGDAREWALCDHYGIERTKHDSKPYTVASDVETADKRISVKSAKATLMSGRFCKRYETLEEIWVLYRNTTHSDTFAYITRDFRAYEMDIDEFERFVHAFGYVTRDSVSNGGFLKIRFKDESQKMLAWLAENVA